MKLLIKELFGDFVESPMKVIMLFIVLMLMSLGAEADTLIITYEPVTESFQRITVENNQACQILGDLFLEVYPDADYVCVDGY